MLIRWILFALIFLLARRVLVAWLGKGRRGSERVGAQRPRRGPGAGRGTQARQQREKDLAAGQRIEEADFEELD